MNPWCVGDSLVYLSSLELMTQESPSSTRRGGSTDTKMTFNCFFDVNVFMISNLIVSTFVGMNFILLLGLISMNLILML